MVLRVVDQTKRRHRTRSNAQVLQQPLSGREAQLAITDLLGHCPQVGSFRHGQNDQVMAGALLIPQKEVLAVNGVDSPPVLEAFVARGNRRMLVPVEWD